MKRTSKTKPFWERAYRGHAFLLGKTKLGKVTLAGKDRYTWEAAGRAGEAADLDKAKKAVEMAVLIAAKQMDLFNG